LLKAKTITIRPVTREAQGKLLLPWKIVLDIVGNYWTKFKKFGPFSENFSPL